MTDIKSLLEMKLHESITIEITSEAGVIKLTIIRVTDGWIYTRKGQPGTFVPEPQPVTEMAAVHSLPGIGFDAHVRNLIRSGEETDDMDFDRKVMVWRSVEAALGQPVFSKSEVQTAWLAGHFFCDSYNPEPGSPAWTAMVEFFKTTFNIDL